MVMTAQSLHALKFKYLLQGLCTLSVHCPDCLQNIGKTQGKNLQKHWRHCNTWKGTAMRTKLRTHLGEEAKICSRQTMICATDNVCKINESSHRGGSWTGTVAKVEETWPMQGSVSGRLKNKQRLKDHKRPVKEETRRQLLSSFCGNSSKLVSRNGQIRYLIHLPVVH